jgi:hypothetical protein
MNVVRAISTEGFGRLRYHRDVRRRLDKDPQFLPYFEQETTKLPQYYFDLVRKDLGLLWEWLPEGALDHDPNAYSKSEPDSTHALRSVLGIASEGRKIQAGGRL